MQRKGLLTFVYYCAFAYAGLMISSLGPALLRLAEQTNSSVSQLVWTFFARSVGYATASGFAGPLFDRMPGHRIVSVSILFTIFGALVIPFVPYLWLLAIIVVCQGMAMGCLDVGGNVMLIWLYPVNVEPKMQAMHFAFGVGAFLSPMIVGSFLSTSASNPLIAPFTLFGLSGIPVIIALCVIPTPANPHSAQEMGQPWTRHEELVILLVSFYMFLYVGAEVACGGFVYSYAVTRKLAGEVEAAWINSGFWGSFALSRLAAVYISTKWSSKTMLTVNTIGCLTSLAVILISVRSTVWLWIGVCSYGWWMASCFPSAMSLADSYLKVTGKVAAFFVVGASLGEMTLPLMTALLFDIDSIWLFGLSLIVGVLGFAVLVLLFAKGVTKDTHNKLQQQQQPAYSQMEMELQSPDPTATTATTATTTTPVAVATETDAETDAESDVWAARVTIPALNGPQTTSYETVEEDTVR